MHVEWLGAIDPAEYLALDRRELGGGEAGARAAIARSAAVSLGVSYRPPERIREEAQRRGWPVLRRTTGGTAVLHLPGDLLWSVVLPTTHPVVGRGFVRAYDRLGAPIAEALRSAGVPASWGTAFALSDDVCLLGRRGQALRAGERAIGGAAQHLAGGRLLHHGVVLGARSVELLAGLLGVADADLDPHLTSLAEARPPAAAADVARAALDGWARW